MLDRLLNWLRRNDDDFCPSTQDHAHHYHPTGAPWEAPSKWCAEMRVLKINGRCCMCEATAVGIEVQLGKGIFGLWEPVRVHALH